MEKVPARQLGMAAFLGGNTLLERRRKANLALETECAAKRLCSSQIPKMSRTKTDAELLRAKQRNEVLRNRRPRPAVPKAAPVVEEPVAAVVSSAVEAPSSINPARRKTAAAKRREEGVHQRRLQRQSKDRVVAREEEENKVEEGGLKRASPGLESARKRVCRSPRAGSDEDPLFSIRPEDPREESQAQAPDNNKHDEASDLDVKTMRGLVNIQEACYSNAALQLLDAALSPVQVKALRGSTSIDPLATGHDALLQHSREGALNPRKRSGYQTFRKAVREMWDEEKGVKVSPYLGDLLSNLRRGITEVSKLKEEDTYVTPLFFQSLFALSNDVRKTPYDGLSQQDSAEYLGSVLASVIDEGTVSEDSFATYFEVEQTCVNGCKHSRRCDDQTHQVLRATVTEKRTDLTKLVSKALESNEDFTHLTCKNCKSSGTLWQHQKATSLPENLVISIDRSLILKAKVDIPYGEVIKLQEHRYRVKAVVCHMGQGRNSGHYRAVREHNGDHYILDDSTVSLVRSVSSIQDGCKVGNSCTILLQRFDTANQVS